MNLTAIIQLKEEIAVSPEFTVKERDFILDCINLTIKAARLSDDPGDVFKFALGPIQKGTGDYGGPGVIVARFSDYGKVRYVVRFEIKDGFGSFYHILTETQLTEPRLSDAAHATGRTKAGNDIGGL